MPEHPTVYSLFWILRALDRQRGADPEITREVCDALGAYDTVQVRGAYSTAGLRADADAIIWLNGTDLDDLQSTWLALRSTALGQSLQPVETYLGLAEASQYVADHSPAFLRDVPPKTYLSVYPFVKTHEWYLLPYEDRRDLMREHGELGREFPTILTNTVSSFGLGDPEFIVAIEGDDPMEIMRMMRRLRAAEVRKYTSYDTPIYLGRRVSPEELVRQLRA